MHIIDSTRLDLIIGYPNTLFLISFLLSSNNDVIKKMIILALLQAYEIQIEALLYCLLIGITKNITLNNAKMDKQMTNSEIKNFLFFILFTSFVATSRTEIVY